MRRPILAGVHFSALSAPEQRVLGCLIEKRFTTPDGYPLSLNALRLACNQSTNREPVVEYDEATVRDAAQRLSRYGLARLAVGHTSRSVKYRHLAEDALGLDRVLLVVLAVLLLRGPQTPGELKARTERMAPTGSLTEVEAVVERLVAQGYAERLPRRPGQKEDRFRHRLGGVDAEPPPAGEPGSRPPAPAGPQTPVPARPDPEAGRATGRGGPEENPGYAAALAARVERLERELATVRAELGAIRGALGRDGEAAPTAPSAAG